MSVTWLLRLLFISLLCILSLLAKAAGPETKFDSFGIYVRSADQFIKLNPYRHYDRFVAFEYLNEVPAVQRPNQQVQFIVYSKDFRQSDYAFAIRPLDVDLRLQSIPFKVQPLAEKYQYAITLQYPVANGDMVHVYSGEFFGYNMGVIMLGEPQQELLEYFSQKDLSKPSKVLASLEQALRAFPHNARLGALLPYWQKVVLDARDIQDYAYIDEKWQQYQVAEVLHLKLHYLRAILGEANAYLREHPQGLKATEARRHKAYAEEKIQEYASRI